MGTKADDEERKKQRLAALEAARHRGAASAGTDADAMRAEILREREKRRAAMKAAMRDESEGRSLGDPSSTGTVLDPARARVAGAAARVVAAADAKRLATLCRIACNAAEDAFGDTAPTFANPENAFALATETERASAATRVDKRSVKLANAKVREAFFGVDAAKEGDGDGAAVDAFVAAGFVLENDDATDEDSRVVDARRLTLPYTADVRVVSFLVERMASGAKDSADPLAPLVAKIARLAAPGYREKKKVDPTKPPIGGRRPQAFVPPKGASAAARVQLDDAFFRRDASEVAEEYARAKSRREAQSTLTTRAWKEARKKEAKEDEESTNRARNASVTVRVRLPDGTQLRGMFGPREPVGAVRAFVHESLREPFRGFDLAFLGAPLRGDEDGPAGARGRKPRDSLAGLRTHNVRDPSGSSHGWSDPRVAEERVGHKGVGYGEEGTVAGAGLAPSALITFSWAEPARPGENTDGDPRVLNDALCATAQPLE